MWIKNFKWKCKFYDYFYLLICSRYQFIYPYWKIYILFAHFDILKIYHLSTNLKKIHRNSTSNWFNEIKKVNTDIYIFDLSYCQYIMKYSDKYVHQHFISWTICQIECDIIKSISRNGSSMLSFTVKFYLNKIN
jgi:hypothetical protein